MYFRTYGLRNTWLDKGLNSLNLENSLRSNKVNGTKHCWNPNDNTYHIYWSLLRQLGLKKYLWVICKILGLFVNPLTADDKYSLLSRGDLLQHFQMQLSHKQEIFSEFSFAFSKLRFNFQHSQIKDDIHSWCIFELKDSQKPG